MIEVVDAIRELVEPTNPAAQSRSLNGPKLDRTAARPFVWEADTFYAYEENSAQESIGTGGLGGGEVREDFSIMLVYVATGNGEESVLSRSRATSEALDEKRTAYLNALRHANAREGLWAYLTGASIPEYLREFEVRGIAVRATGYRLIAD